MIESATASAVNVHVLAPGEQHLPAHIGYSDGWRIAFLTEDGDGIIVEGDHPADVMAAIEDGARELRLKSGHYPATQPAHEMRAQRHEELRNVWIGDKPEWWNHDARADRLFNWATDPATPERDAGIYAAMGAAERNASVALRQLECGEETRDGLAGVSDAIGEVESEVRILRQVVDAGQPEPATERGRLARAVRWLR